MAHGSSASPKADSEPGNRHLSPGADGNTLVDLDFIEEPLGVGSEQGHGYPQLDFGQSIGPDGRYEVVRKLNFGGNASVWAALDRRRREYVAIKILKGYSTDLAQRGLVWELPAFERLRTRDNSSSSTHCMVMRDHFLHPGKDDDGSHLCFVTDLMGGDVRSLIPLCGGRPFPLRLAKRILHHTLLGLAHMHRCGIVHTDLKHDNILFSVGGQTSKAYVDELVRKDPSRLNPPEHSWPPEKVVRSAVSQPLPLPTLEEAVERDFVLGDFGSAQSVADHRIDEITTDNLRAPETILRGPWNEKVDIWAFGCLIFEILVGQRLFEYKAYPEHQLDEVAGHLWQMTCFTGEGFEPDQLNVSDRALDYFDTSCMLKARPPRYSNPIRRSLSNYEALSDATVHAASKLAERCLRLDPANRPSAEQLLKDPWWTRADI